MTTVALSSRVQARPASRRELAQALLGWAEAARLEAGIVRATVSEDVEVAATFELVSEWESSAHLEAHVRSDPFGVLLGALGVLALPYRMTVARTTDECEPDAFPALRRHREVARDDAQRRPEV
jgi:quinol monooxygenase YgiN